MGARSEQWKGTRLGAYEIVRLIGHGATASVFEATHVDLDKPVAIKVLHEHLGANLQVKSRFVREGKVAARLQHPNIVNIIDVGSDRGTPYLIMDLLRGGDLRALLADVGILSAEHALDFLLPIVSALAHAHATGVVHRDVKPANVFLSRDARDVVVPKLVDFGLSKATTSGEELASELTSTGLVAGTVLYMAPEQTAGVRNAAPASDQYSIAAILYEALTGEPPFTGDGVYALLERIRSAPLRPPSALNPAVNRELEAVVVRALQRDPAQRWASTRALGRELLPFASQSTVDLIGRDFVERTSERTSIGPSWPAATTAVPPSADAETRIERTSGTARIRLPDGAPSPGKSPFHVKGLPYRGFMFHVERTASQDAFLRALDPSLRAFAAQPFLASRRYDVFPFLPLFETLAQMRGVPLEALVKTATAAQVRYDARTAYRLILDANRPEDIVSRVERFNTQIFDFGHYSASLTDGNRGVLVFSDIPAYLEPWFSPMHVSYAMESLRLAGATDVEIASHVAEDAGTQEGYPLRTYKTELRWKI